MSRCHLQIPAELQGLARIVAMVEAFCGANNVPATTCNIMNLVLDEVLSNIVKYAYEVPEQGTIDVELVCSNAKLMASVEDRGIAFNPLELPTPAGGGPLQSRQEGGLGIVFMKSLLDSVVYERVGDRNRVTLTLKVPSASPSVEQAHGHR